MLCELLIDCLFSETKAVHISLSHDHTLQIIRGLAFLIVKIISIELFLCASILNSGSFVVA